MSLHGALINIINGKRHQSFGICCLCLKTVESNALRLEDEVIVNGSLNAQSLLEILGFILGDEIEKALSMDNPLCDLCKIMAVKCYSFIKTCKETIKGLQNAVNTLADGLTESTGYLTGHKSLFVTLNTSDCTTTLYYDNKRPITYRSLLIKRLQILMHGKTKHHRKADFVNDDEFDTDPIDCGTDVKTENGTNLSTTLRQLRNNVIQDINSQLTENTIETDNVPKLSATQNTIKKRAKSTTTIATKDMMYGKYDMRCKICLQSFSVCKNLRQHYLRVHAAKEFKCFHCPKRYGSQPLLDGHMLLSHTPSICSICGKSYSNRNSLKQHEAGHNFKLMCSKCGKCYKTPTTLRTHTCHESRATLEKKYACDNCDKRFVRKATIRTHIQFEHGDGKAHICMWCNKRFAAQSTLNLHIVKHTHEKNFGCEICGRNFVTKASLLYHTRTHTGEKPYGCRVCDMKFLSASRRSQHERHTHSSATVECDVCHSKFKSRSNLLRHQKIHHNCNSKLDSFKSSEDD